MIRDKLFDFQNKNKCTYLGIGPMSQNCVDVTIDLANNYECPFFLIASRRQIDSEQFGGGYVNNWTTEEFAKYVLEKSKKGNIYLCRDHGGPWQNTIEVDKKLNLEQAMDSAKNSFLADIKSGFKILHLDPSIDIFRKVNNEELVDRLINLYEFCWEKSKELKKEITFEIGTEEQSGSNNPLKDIEFTIDSVKDFCSKRKIPEPIFVVVQCGTRVLETENVGSFDTPIRISNEIPAEIQVLRAVNLCRKKNIMMKAHNTDYLSDDSLSWHPKLGINSANVAPEFGVAETKSFLKILKENCLNSLLDEFIQISYESKKWKKWLKPDSKTNDLEKAIISGHYVFATEEFKNLKNKANSILSEKGVNLDKYLKNDIKIVILKYLNKFNLI